jgi:hypothetical protein
VADTSRTVVTSLVQITVPCTSGIPDRADFLMSLVPRTLSGITAAQAKDFLRDILVYAKGSAQLNYT